MTQQGKFFILSESFERSSGGGREATEGIIAFHLLSWELDQDQGR